jgi:glutathione synthase/RimK-type ligase-like ATP-grasp enzyme
MTLKVFPYKLGSLSAKRLARALRVLRVGHTYNAKRSDIIINWGNSKPPHFKWLNDDLNKPHAIALASNKLKTFNTFIEKGFFHLPAFTTSKDVAKEVINSGDIIYCRSTVTGHSGRGIVIASNSNELINAPLYTVKTKHKDEYRVHVFKGEVLDVQKKKRKLGFTGRSSGIRNYSNGWVYARADVAIPDMLCPIAIQAVELLGLDFGAVDIGHRIIDNKFFVFEVNTAPGLEGSTLDKYAKAIYNYYSKL